MAKKHHVHMQIPDRLNTFLEGRKDELGKSKTAIMIELLEKEQERVEAESTA